MDGLGRPIQGLTVEGSDKKHIVQPIVYDELGRTAREYLPIRLITIFKKILLVLQKKI